MTYAWRAAASSCRLQCRRLLTTRPLHSHRPLKKRFYAPHILPPSSLLQRHIFQPAAFRPTPLEPWSVVQQVSPWGVQQSRSLSNVNSHNPYEVLGVSESATPAEIKRKYYDLAKRYHPDSTHEDSDRAIFVKVSSAYELLSDPQRRARYDATGQFDEAAATEAHAQDIFTHVWQEFGIKEYMEAMQEDGATAIHAARHGDYSLLWEFAKERKVLIASTLLPLAAMVRFPGLFGFFLRLGVLFTIPPRVAYNIFRQLIFRKR